MPLLPIVLSAWVMWSQTSMFECQRSSVDVIAQCRRVEAFPPRIVKTYDASKPCWLDVPLFSAFMRQAVQAATPGHPGKVAHDWRWCQAEGEAPNTDLRRVRGDPQGPWIPGLEPPEHAPQSPQKTPTAR